MPRTNRLIRVVSAVALFLLLVEGCARATSIAPTTFPTANANPTALPPLPSPAIPTIESNTKPPACTQIGQEWVSPIDGVTLVCVPAGEFLMGADENDADAAAHEKPQHKVVLDAFWIDKTENTNAAFAKCVAAGVCAPRPARRGTTGVASLKHLNYYYDAEFANYPVLIYKTIDALTYCQWAGRRLPTEAEWEKAARGTDGREFPWGEGQDCKYATFFGCTEDTTDVTSAAAGVSPYGALNMAGNVWEWVADQFDETYYANPPGKNPTGPVNGEGMVRRGGGWRSLTRDLRVTTRANGVGQHYFDGQMGFRCAVSASEP